MDSIPAIRCVNGKETFQKNVDSDIDTRSCQPISRLRGFWVLGHLFILFVSQYPRSININTVPAFFSSGLGLSFAGLDFNRNQ
jgi:hypothetical protein